MNLDARDLTFWFREAQKTLIQDQMKAIQAARLAQADNSSYQEVMSGLQEQISKLEYGEEKVVKISWEELKEKGKG